MATIHSTFQFRRVLIAHFAVLNSKQILRRWRECNLELVIDSKDESASQMHDLLKVLHTLGGISDVNFDVVDSREAVSLIHIRTFSPHIQLISMQDLAFELDCGGFKWRWDAYLLGPKTSSDIISKQLIMPLITLTHVSFYSADPISELDEADLEKVSVAFPSACFRPAF